MLPISDKFLDYAKSIHTRLRKAGIRSSVDDRSEKIGKKIREAEIQRVPYMLVVGEKEMEEGKASVRRQGKGDLGAKSLDDIISDLRHEIAERIPAE